MIANSLCGVFMTLVHSITNNMAGGEYPLFQSLLRIFLILSIPAVGLQTVLAQEAARTITSDEKIKLKGVIRAALIGTFALWLAAVGVLALFQSAITHNLNVPQPTALWITLLAALPALWLPILQGTLQGTQIFSWLGFSMIFNGAARFMCMILLVRILHGKASSAMAAALLGVAGATCIAAWPMRALLVGAKELVWGAWLKRTIPLTLGTGSVLFVMSADIIFVNAHFPRNVAKLYGAAATLGLALVMFTTPLAAVMFPKLVRSVVTEQKSSALFNALAGTALLGIIGALLCGFFPELPLRIMYYGNADYLRAAPLVKLFMWAMLPVTLANVLVGNLLARENWKVVPWLTAAALGSGLSLS